MCEKQLGEPSWKYIYQLHVSECKLLMFAIECVLCRTVSLYILLVCFGNCVFGNCVLTWYRVSVNMCDSPRGDLDGMADRT